MHFAVELGLEVREREQIGLRRLEIAHDGGADPGSFFGKREWDDALQAQNAGANIRQAFAGIADLDQYASESRALDFILWRPRRPFADGKIWRESVSSSPPIRSKRSEIASIISPVRDAKTSALEAIRFPSSKLALQTLNDRILEKSGRDENLVGQNKPYRRGSVVERLGARHKRHAEIENAADLGYAARTFDFGELLRSGSFRPVVASA